MTKNRLLARLPHPQTELSIVTIRDATKLSAQMQRSAFSGLSNAVTAHKVAVVGASVLHIRLSTPIRRFPTSARLVKHRTLLRKRKQTALSS